MILMASYRLGGRFTAETMESAKRSFHAPGVVVLLSLRDPLNL
jgi:hypothetical protein